VFGFGCPGGSDIDVECASGDGEGAGTAGVKDLAVQ
jgi:hypothetical protein